MAESHSSLVLSVCKVKVDLTGQRFSKLLVVSYRGHDSHGNAYWNCLCDCGQTTIVRSSHLVSGSTVSCGCHRRERAGRIGRSSAGVPLTHGLTYAPEYTVWASMIQRCTNPNENAYRDYGGRGIAVCERWLKFEHFYADMGPRPSPKHMIDRINTNGNYEPGNCRWVTRKEQNRNKRNTLWIEYRGERKTLADWADSLNVSWDLLWNRLKAGWSVERAFTERVHPNRPNPKRMP